MNNANKNIVAGSIIVGMTFLCYCISIGSGLISDDYKILVQGMNGFTDHQFFRPGTFWLNMALFGKVPWLYHLCNVILHAGNALLLWFIAAQWFRNELISSQPFLTAIFFVCWPTHVDSVVWISGAASVFSTFLFLSSLYCLFQYDNTQKLFYFLAALLCWFAALCTYESAWVGLWIFPMIFYLKRSWPLKKILRLIFSLMIIFLAYLLLRYQFIGDWIGTYGDLHQRVDVTHIVLNLFRFTFRAMMPPYEGGIYFWLYVFWYFLFFAIFLFRQSIRILAKPTMVHLFLFLCALLPVLNLGIAWRNTEGERFLYLPGIFLILYFVEVFSLMQISVQKWMLPVFIILSASYLIQVQQKWRSSHQQIVSFYHQLKQQKDYQAIKIIDLPVLANGTYALRVGFQEGMLWHGIQQKVPFQVKSRKFFQEWPKYQMTLQSDTLLVNFSGNEFQTGN
jgi:hypothetical protein